MFNIKFNRQSLDPTPKYNKLIRGQITLDDFSESFESALSYWSITDYERQWREACTRIARGCKTSALITNFHDPAQAIYYIWWPMFRDGDQVIFRNCLLFLKDIRGQFNKNDFYRHIHRRAMCNIPGMTYSEWILPVEDIVQFARK